MVKLKARSNKNLLVLIIFTHTNLKKSSKGDHVKKIILLLILNTILLISCKSNDSDTSVVGGKNIDGYLNVVLLHIWKDNGSQVRASAVIVSDSTLITAAHILEKLTPGESEIEAIFTLDKNPESLSKTKIFKKNPKFSSREDFKNTAAYDIGVVVFPDKPFENLIRSKIASYYPQKGARVRLAGYGSPLTTILDPETNEVKHIEPVSDDIMYIKTAGTNTLKKPEKCAPGMLEIQAEGIVSNNSFISKEDGGYSSSVTSAGDSGSPMIQEKGNIIMGITSYGNFVSDLPPKFTSCYASPIFEPNLEFLKSTILDPKINADIPGIINDKGELLITPLKEKDFKME